MKVTIEIILSGINGSLNKHCACSLCDCAVRGKTVELPVLRGNLLLLDDSTTAGSGSCGNPPINDAERRTGEGEGAVSWSLPVAIEIAYTLSISPKEGVR